jgi:tetratricopeptide (TPR) repeat protein
LIKSKGEISIENTTINKKKSIILKLIIPLISGAVLIGIFLFVLFLIIIPNNIYSRANKLFNEEQYIEAYEELQKLNRNFKDTEELLLYYRAFVKFTYGDYESALNIFETLNNYSNSANMVIKCKYLTAENLLERREFESAIAAFSEIIGFNDSEQRILETNYLIAENLLEQGEYESAILAFSEIIAFSDSKQRIFEAKYLIAENLLAQGEYKFAILTFSEIIDFNDSEQRIFEAKYREAIKLFENKEYDEAYIRFEIISTYKNSEEMMLECRYLRGIELFNEKDFVSADGLFTALGNYKDSINLSKESRYLQADDYFEKGNYENAVELYGSLGNYKDSSDKKLEASYSMAMELYLSEDLETALSIFTSLSSYRNSLTLAVIITNEIEEQRARQRAVDWTISQIGNEIKGTYGAQCVELIKAYYRWFGVETSWGNAHHYWVNTLPDGWTRIAYTAEFIPQPGDIAVWDTNEGGGFGHVAIIISANIDNFTSVDQNWFDMCLEHGSKAAEVIHDYTHVFGVIRPKFT